MTKAPLTVPGLVAAYSFDEGAGTAVTDLSENGNNGTVFGADWSTGVHGGALSFDDGDSLTVPDASALDLTTSMTLEAWINPASRDASAYAFIKEVTGNTPAYALFASDANNRAAAAITGSANYFSLDSTTSPPLGQWTHLAATYDAPVLKLYLNGLLSGEATVEGPLATSDAPLSIGNGFDGTVDDVRIYNRALSAAELQADMDTPVADVPSDAGPPSVAISAPVNGTTLGYIVTLAANASDDSALGGVRFLVDGESIGSQVTQAPYSIAWDTRGVPNGAHTITARARDAAGNGSDATISVTVANVENGAIAAYNFDEGEGAVAGDSSGNFNTGALEGATFSSAGKHGGAVSFDGNGWVSAEQNSTLDLTTGMTLEAWVRPNSLPTPSVEAVVKEGPGSITYGLFVNDTLDADDPGGHPAAWVNTDLGLEPTFTDGTVPLGEWTHLAATADGHSLKYYVNGVLQATSNISGPIVPDFGPLKIGGNNVNGNWFDGLIDDVRVYERALSDTEIAADMGTPVGIGNAPPVPGLVAAYAFDEGSGTTVGDLSGMGNNGAISGATWGAGVHGNALTFDGQNDWVTIPDSDSLDLTTGMTLEAWLRPTARRPWESALLKEGDTDLSYAMYAYDSFDSIGGVIHGADFDPVVRSVTLPLDTWTHVAITYDANLLNLYVDGDVQAGVYLSTPLPVTSGPLHIGGDSLGEDWFEGSIDEVRVYNRALSRDEILRDMDEPIVNFTRESTPPTISISSPSEGATVTGQVAVTAAAGDDQGLAGVRFLIDGKSLGNQVTASPYAIAWDTRQAGNGDHTLSAVARDLAGNTTTTTRAVTVSNAGNGLVAAYGFNEGAGTLVGDASNSHNDGSLVDGTWTSDGKYGGALSFDGEDDYVNVPDSSSLDLTIGMTLETWLRPESLDTWMSVIRKNYPGDLSYALYASNDDGDPGAWLGSDFGEELVSVGYTQLPLDEWSHVAVTFDGATVIFYVNGEYWGSLYQPAVLPSSSEPLQLGGNTASGDWFNGSLDDVRIYSRPLTQEEIQLDMITPVAGSGGGDPCVGATLDDGNPCTTDACNPGTGVTHTPVAAGTSCSDGNACNGTETCDASGTCAAGTPVVCVALDQCHTAGTCDTATGACTNPAQSDGAACSDGNACTQTDTCQAGTCTPGAELATDDGNPCTTDSCNPSTGVTHVPVSAGTSCSDGNACNGAETCDASGACSAGMAPAVDDGNPCTADACNPASGVTHTPASAGTSCSDGNACNGAETCDGSGSCAAGTPISVDDNNACTDDSCDPVAGVAHIPRAAGSSCSDFDLCNGNETCDGAGTCQPGTPVAIDTSNACNSGTCDPATGVVTYTPRPQGASCLVDTCNTGTCNGSGECTASGSTVHDDGDACTLEWCDPVLGPQQSTCSKLDRTVGTTLNQSMQWLYAGTNPIQQGVAPGTIQTERAVALRGLVTTRDGAPLPGVNVTIRSRPEFGHTLTQSNGYFNMVVNGGGTLIVDYQRPGYLRAQRQITSQWNEYAALPDVVMIPPDSVATTMDMTGGTSDVQAAQASVVSDQSGTRQGVLLVPPGTQATMHLPDGSTQPLDSMNVRMTEYTIGPDGDKAMPGNLPSDSKYTYAFDVNADEAVAANATSITFDAPLVYYVDNFLQFPAGTTVPLGFYDPVQSAWVPSDSGIALDIVAISGGRAQIDLTGDGVAETTSDLATKGISDAEQEKLAELYTPGRMLWRVLLPHFSTWDENWGGGPPSGATGPNGGGPNPPGPCECCGAGPLPPPGTPTPPPPGAPPPPDPGSGNVDGWSRIQCDSQVLTEKLPIAGTPYSLNYSSERTPGYLAANKIAIPLSGATVPSSLLRIDLDVTVEGVKHHQEFPPNPNQITTFTWDGLDAFGRKPQGAVIASVSIGFVYEYTYTKTDRFGYSGNGLVLTVEKRDEVLPPGRFELRCTGNDCVNSNVETLQEIAVTQTYPVPIGSFEAKEEGLGGWTLSVEHVDELLPKRLELGTGQRFDTDQLPPVLEFVSDGDFHLRGAVAVGPDKTSYFAGSNRVYSMAPGQAAVPFAGNGNTSAYGGDGLPATDPAVGLSASDVAIGREGSVYIADTSNQIVRRVGPDGIIHTIAGVPGVRSIPANDGPATATPMADPRYLAVGADGTVYVSTAADIMKISTDGQLIRAAGLNMTSLGGNADSPPNNGDDGVATQIRIEPHGLAVAPDGTLYAILGGCAGGECVDGSTIVKFVDGIMSRVVGNGCVSAGCPAWSDGSVAKDLGIRATGLTFDEAGTLYFSDIKADSPIGASSVRVAMLTADGLLYAVAGVHGGPGTPQGSGLSQPAGPGQPATNAVLADPTGGARFISEGPDGLYVTSQGASNHTTVYHVSTPLPHDTGNPSVVASRSGDSYFTFDPSGRHLSTKQALTGADLLHFGYDASGHVATITDEAGKITTVERDGAGNPVAIVSPFGQRSELELDANGYLARVTDPEGHDTVLGYDNGGLLTTLTNTRGVTGSMQYDSSGFLQIDSDPAGGSQTFTRAETNDGTTVTRTTALGRTTTYGTTVLPGDRRTRIQTAPDGTEREIVTGPDKLRPILEPDGTTIVTSEVPDARFGLGMPVVTRVTTLPSGLASTETASRSYTNLDPANLLDFVDMTDQTVVNGQTWRTRYTAATKTFVTTTPANRTSTRTIDEFGRTITAQLGALVPISLFYDGNGRVDHTTRGSGPFARTTSRGYFASGAAAGYLQTVTDAMADATTYTRDTLGRTLTENRAGATSAVTWDPESNVASVTPPGKPTHGMTYTPINLLESYNPPIDGLPIASTSYAYDADRMLRTETRPDGEQIVRTPDGVGRLDTVQIPGGMLDYAYYPAGTPSGAGKTSDILGPYGVNLHFTYDGKLTTSMSWSGDVTGSVAWTYNNDFNKSLETVDGATGSGQVVFGYDADRLLSCVSPTTCNPPGSDALSISRDPAGLIDNIGLGSTNETLSYNTFGELARQTATYAPSTPLVDITYDAPGVERDKLGRVVQKTEVISGVTNVYVYNYDHLRRLTDVTLNGTLAEHFEYDANGNRTIGFNAAAGTTYTGAYDDQDRLQSYGPFDYTYTANGELETKTNRDTGDAWLFQYDALGNLLTVGLPNGDLVEYLVDGMGRRVGKKKNGVLLKQWIYRDALKPVAELDGAGSLVSEFVYGSKSNVPDYVLRGGAMYRVISDQLGSPRYVVNVANATDVPFAATYTSFGVMTGTGLDWMPFGFAGGIYDGDSGLVRFGKRDMDPSPGRWTAKDPIRFHGGQGNLFVYSGNDPVNRHDSSGLAVDICERLALNPALHASGVNHQWIRTGSMEAGIGGTREETEVDSESGEGDKPGASCYTVPNVDEDCVNNILTNEFGQMTGPWVPFSNDCVTFVDDVINMCTVSWNPEGGGEGASGCGCPD